MSKNSIYDNLARPLHDLRISVIDRCNFRCTYCMPEEEGSHYSFLKEDDWLTFDEIIRLTKLFIQLGTKKVRITGGEPLLRPKLPELIEQLSQFQELEDLALTTNGSLLSRYAKRLKEAGLARLTVSLDTLDPNVFQTMSGGKGSVTQVLEGLNEAERAGFESIKVNVVIQKGVNDHTILDLVNYFRTTAHILRFIEYMDVGNCNHWSRENVVPSSQIVQLINTYYPLEPVQSNYYGEVANRYKFLDGLGEIGFVSSVTQPFCKTCTRARISTNGILYTCLFSEKGEDLRIPLRSGVSDKKILEVISKVWQKREDRYSEKRSEIIESHQHPHKVEMFQIGG